METINNVAAAAARAVWGEGEANKEPVSGARGDVSKGEPYDAGNLDPASQTKIENSMTGGVEAESTPKTNLADTPAGQNDTRDYSEINSDASKQQGIDTNFKDTTAGQNDILDHSEVNSDASKQRGIDTNLTDTTAGQNDTRDPAEPTSDASKQRDIDTNLADTTAGQNDTRDPDEISPDASKRQDIDTNTPGPTSEAGQLKGTDGPLPLRVVAQKDGGDAGNEAGHERPSADSSSNPENAGTGQEYVKTTGFAADGGDFDATKPGAGREAERLLDEKAHRGEGGSEGGGSHSSHGHGKDKPSLGDRIKAKIHKH